MKKLNLTILLTLLLSMVGAKVFAHDISVANADDKTIYYTWRNNKTELSVSYRGNGSSYDSYSNTYSGNLVIPKTVTYNSKDYPVTAIGYNAFRSCYGLTSLTVPSSVTSIGSNLFEGCSSLTSINVESGNTTYDSRNNCNAIIKTETNELVAGCKNTVIPNSITSIGYSAFYGCSGLSSVNIPNSVTKIGSFAFYNCYNLASITIPSSVTSIGSGAFTGTGFYETAPDGWFYVGQWLCGYKGTMPVNTTLAIKEGTVGVASGAFLEYAENIVGVTIPSSMTSITFGAFAGFYKLATITIPNTVTSIGICAFEMCFGLTSITIPNSVTSIGNSAFRECSSLTSITIPNSVTSIGDNAFAMCSGLTSIDIPNSVTSIGDNAFSGCSKLTNVTIPNSVTIISNGLLSYCSGLTNIVIPNSVTSIGEYAFDCCSGLTSITIPNSVTSIGKSAFKECDNLKTVNRIIDIAEWCQKDPITYGDDYSNPMYGVYYDQDLYASNGKVLHLYCDSNSEIKDLIIPEGVVSVRSYAFAGVGAITSVTLPTTLSSIGENAFIQCTGLNKVTFHCKNVGNWFGWGWWSEDWDGAWFNPIKEVIIGEEVENVTNGVFQIYKILSSISINSSTIGAWFNNLTSLKTAIIGDNVTSISESAFANCSGLTSLIIGKNVKTIGNSAFSGCSALPQVVLPNGLTSVGNSTFANCNALNSVQLPNGITTIGCSAFSGCKSLESILLPNSLTSIGSLAFSDCTSLSSIMLPVGIKTVESGTFSGCSALASIQYPNALTSIGSAAFQGNAFTSISIPNTVTSIGDNAYKNCKSLASVTIPSSVTTIGSGVFSGCTALTTANVDCQTIGTWFSGLTSLKTVTIGENATSIGESAFANCSGLASLTIGKNVTAIGNSAFANCSSLEPVSLPSGLTTLGSSAFSGCSALTAIEIPSGVRTIGANTFKGCSKLASIQMPKEITSIGGSAFYGCGALKAITLPSSLTSLGTSAFQNCSALALIALPDGIKTIESLTFAGCSALASIQYSKALTSIGSSAFQGSGFTEITIPSTVSSIGANAYTNSTKLASAVIPSSVTTIGSNVFSGCTKLTALSVDCKTISTWFSGLTAIKELTIGSSTIDISASAFANCTGIETLSIGKNVAAIGYSAFSRCNKLATVKTYIEEPYWIDASVFEYALSSTTTLYVPKGKVSLYKNLSCWNQFPKIVEMDGEENPDEPIVTDAEELSVDEIKTNKGKQVSVGINLTNSSDDLTAFQFDLTLPTGITIAQTSNGKYQVSKTDRFADDNQQLNVSLVSGNTYRVLCFSMEKDVITGNTGAVLNVVLQVSKDIEPGSYEGMIKDIVFTKTDGTQEKLDDVSISIVIKPYIPGDANGDEEINVTDIVEMVNAIMEKPSERFVKEAADVNSDSDVNVTDIVLVVSMIMEDSSRARLSDSDLMALSRRTGDDLLTNNDFLALSMEASGWASLELTNETEYVAAQFDIRVGEGQQINAVTLNGTRKNGHLVSYEQTGHNTWRVLVYSLDNETFLGSNGELLNISIDGNRKDVTIDNILFVTNQFSEERFAPLHSGTTGVDTMLMDGERENGKVYDLQGRQIDSSTQRTGVLIINSKKVLK